MKEECELLANQTNSIASQNYILNKLRSYFIGKALFTLISTPSWETI